MRYTFLYVLAIAVVVTGCAGGSSSGDVQQPTADSMKDSKESKNTNPSPQVTEDAEQSAGTNDVRTIEMTARQFAFEPSTIRVKKGQTIRLKVTATDVTHGIGIPAFGIDKRLPPGKTVTIEFTPDKRGTFRFLCTVVCGRGHSSMTGKLIVE